MADVPRDQAALDRVHDREHHHADRAEHDDRGEAELGVEHRVGLQERVAEALVGLDELADALKDHLGITAADQETKQQQKNRSISPRMS